LKRTAARAQASFLKREWGLTCGRLKRKGGTKREYFTTKEEPLGVDQKRTAAPFVGGGEASGKMRNHWREP